MKILSILGSPQKKGNTAKVLGWVEDELRAMGHDVERIDMADHKVAGCKACYKCYQHPDKYYCSQNDDAKPIFKKAMKADAIILSSPLFCWEFASTITPLMERAIGLVKFTKDGGRKSYIEGKSFGMVMTCAGPLKNNADLAPKVFKRLTNHVGAVDAGMLIIPGCTEPKDMGDDTRKKAAKFARSLVKHIGG